MDQAPGAMSVFLDVVVMSGRRAQISADLGTSIHEIQQRARRILEIGHGVLLNAKGERLASMATAASRPRKWGRLDLADKAPMHCKLL